MSLLSVIKTQLGQAANTAYNFVLDASAADGTLKLVRENGQQIITTGADNSVTFPSGASFGYGAGAGGTVTQLTSKATAVTLNKVSGKVIMHNASLAAGIGVVFTLNNSTIGADDVIFASISGGAVDGSVYWLEVTGSVGAAKLKVVNNSAGALAEALVINFVVIKGASA